MQGQGRSISHVLSKEGFSGGFQIVLSKLICLAYLQVHNKTVQLQKTNQMNTQINQAYESLSARCRQLEKMLDNALLHSSQVDGAVRQLCGAMLNGMGGEIDHSQLQQFLKTVMPLLSSTNVRIPLLHKQCSYLYPCSHCSQLSFPNTCHPLHAEQYVSSRPSFK